jgi:hypothetical protein
MNFHQTPGVTLYLFRSGTEVLWAEEVSKEAGVPVEVVPSPSDSKNLCGLALQVFSRDASKLEGLMEEEGIPYQEHAPSPRTQPRHEPDAGPGNQGRKKGE